MSRSDQYVGLSEAARALITGLQVQYAEQTCTTTFPNGDVLVEGPHPLYRNTIEAVPYSFIEGAWNDNVADLMEYHFEDGRIWQEYVQGVPWSSGPMYFIALRDSHTGQPIPESLWDEKEMEDY